MRRIQFVDLCDAFLAMVRSRRVTTVSTIATVIRGRLVAGVGGSPPGPFSVDFDMIEDALGGYAEFLRCGSRAARRRFGWRGGWDGPFILPNFTVGVGRPRRTSVGGDLEDLLRRCDAEAANATLHGVTADMIEEHGYPAWAAAVRDLPAIRTAYMRWCLAAYRGDADDMPLINRISWVWIMDADSCGPIPRLGGGVVHA